MALKRQALLWGSIFLAIVGFILHIHQLFAMAATLALLPQVSRFIGRRKLQGLRASRQLVPAVSAGEATGVTVRITNDARTRKIFFTVSDTLPPPLNGAGKNSPELPVAILGPGESARLAYDVQPTRRGVYTLGPVQLATRDPLGIRHYTRQLPVLSELVVYPRPVALPPLWPAAAGGRHPVRPRRRLRGEGDELYGIRDYVAGDDPRRIDWKTTARRGKLAVVEYERPESLEGLIVLDLGESWHGGEEDRHTLEYGVVLAASLAEQALARGSTIGLIAAGSLQDFSLAPDPAEAQRLKLLETLARVQPQAAPTLAQVVQGRAPLLPRNGTVSVISPSPVESELGLWLRGLGQTVIWFMLDRTTFPGSTAATADYDGLEAALLGARCRVHRVPGDRPLEANWRGGGGLAII